MKTQIRAKLGQQQTISMQLQHAMKLMAMPALELQAHVQEMLDENPVLELENTEEVFTAGMRDTATYSDNSDWLAQVQTTISLQDHLHEQCEMLSLEPQAFEIAQTLIDSINETGYLQAELSELFPDFEAPQQHLVRSVLHQIQQFDPPGVAARSLTECLLLQLPHIQAEDEIIQVINQIIHHHMKPLAQNNTELLSEKLNKPVAIIKEAIKTIKQCHPKPGLQIDSNPIENIVPDVIVKVEDGEITILLNAQLSNLKVNPNLTQHADPEHIKDAKDFIYHIHMRNQTLFDVTTSIVKHQKDFFHHGAAALKPLKLEVVAIDTGLHISTISRMTQQKFFHTPHGVCSMKYFFNTAVAQSESSDVANTVVQDLIRTLIDSENKVNPLSDSQLVGSLSEKGFAIARRTVAKYRDQMNIPSSALRKRLE